jgi:hypothetical protein
MNYAFKMMAVVLALGVLVRHSLLILHLILNLYSRSMKIFISAIIFTFLISVVNATTLKINEFAGFVSILNKELFKSEYYK